MRSDDEEKLIAAQNEYKIQKELKHPSIIEVKEMFFDNMRNTIYTVMEYVEGKQLQDLVYQKGPFKGMTLSILTKLFIDSEAKEVMKQLLEGLKYLHE